MQGILDGKSRQTATTPTGAATSLLASASPEPPRCFCFSTGDSLQYIQAALDAGNDRAHRISADMRNATGPAPWISTGRGLFAARTLHLICGAPSSGYGLSAAVRYELYYPIARNQEALGTWRILERTACQGPLSIAIPSGSSSVLPFVCSIQPKYQTLWRREGGQGTSIAYTLFFNGNDHVVKARLDKPIDCRRFDCGFHVPEIVDGSHQVDTEVTALLRNRP